MVISVQADIYSLKNRDPRRRAGITGIHFIRHKRSNTPSWLLMAKPPHYRFKRLLLKPMASTVSKPYQTQHHGHFD